MVAAGAMCVLGAALNLDLAAADIYLGLIAVFIVAVSSRVTIPIPRLNSHVSVSDTFNFLTLLLYGGEYAIVLDAVEP